MLKGQSKDTAQSFLQKVVQLNRIPASAKRTATSRTTHAIWTVLKAGEAVSQRSMVQKTFFMYYEDHSHCFRLWTKQSSHVSAPAQCAAQSHRARPCTAPLAWTRGPGTILAFLATSDQQDPLSVSAPQANACPFAGALDPSALECWV